MLDAVIDFMPAPTDVASIRGVLDDKDETESSRKSSDDEPFAALAFKIATDPFVGNLTFFRVYSGDTVYNPLKGKRNNNGRVTLRHHGGGHKQHYRIIDFKRNKDGIEAKVEHIEYDPNRSAYIALVLYADGERKYIIYPKGLNVGDTIISGTHVPIKSGNCMPLCHIQMGSTVHCIELKPNKGAQLARSAGNSAQLVAREGQYVTLRLRSGETCKSLF